MQWKGTGFLQNQGISSFIIGIIDREWRIPTFSLPDSRILGRTWLLLCLGSSMGVYCFFCLNFTPFKFKWSVACSAAMGNSLHDFLLIFYWFWFLLDFFVVDFFDFSEKVVRDLYEWFIPLVVLCEHTCKLKSKNVNLLCDFLHDFLHGFSRASCNKSNAFSCNP